MFGSQIHIRVLVMIDQAHDLLACISIIGCHPVKAKIGIRQVIGRVDPFIGPVCGKTQVVLCIQIGIDPLFVLVFCLGGMQRPDHTADLIAV